MCLQVGFKSEHSGTALVYGSSFLKRMQALLDYVGFGLCPSLSGLRMCKKSVKHFGRWVDLHP
jgi:hypothetical protein